MLSTSCLEKLSEDDALNYAVELIGGLKIHKIFEEYGDTFL